VGDGAADTTLSLGANVLSFSATHRYLDNRAGDSAYTIDVAVTDKDGAVGTGTTMAVVKNVSPTVEAGANFEVIALHTATIAATFTDPGTKDTHTALINWGDGNVQAGVVSENAGSGNVTGSHVYPFPGSYVVTVVVMDKDSGMGSDTLTVAVLGPTDLKSRAAASLMPYKAESKEIESAIGNIRDSLETTLWLDAIRIDPQHGQKVFDNEEQAVGKLVQLINKQNGKDKNDQVSAAALAAARRAVDAMVEADRLLAVTLTNDAAGMTVVDPKRKDQVARELAAALEEIVKGNVERDAGNFDKAIDRYREAWGHAGQAMEQSITGTRFLAQLAIAKAQTLVPSDPAGQSKVTKEIAQARSELTAGDADLATSSWDKAKEHFKKALDTALGAIDDAVGK